MAGESGGLSLHENLTENGDMGKSIEMPAGVDEQPEQGDNLSDKTNDESTQVVGHKFAIPELPTTITKPPCGKGNLERNEKSVNLKDSADSSATLNCSLISENDDRTSDVESSLNDTSQEKNKTVTESPKSKNSTVSKILKKAKHKNIDFPYQEPIWSGVPDENNKYSLTVLKDGSVNNNIDLSEKSLITFGRLPEACDVLVEHPSCSRFHAVLQYCTQEKDIRKVGYYIYDLGSTHGTFVNKEKVKSKVYVRVHVGYQIKFGGSSRLYIVEGPEEDQEEEIDMEEVRQMRQQNKQRREKEMQGKLSSDERGTSCDDDGASWGFGEDAQEEELDLITLMEKKKNIEVKDPKKTLNGFFEREGIDFEYETSERGRGNSVIHVARVRLPIESSYGVEVIAEGTASNKKDAVLNCATDACKIIQAYDMMQNTCKEGQRIKRQRELEANDFYDSDDDNYLDRTGSVERKRLKRKQWAGKVDEQEAETHESLKTKLQAKTKMLHISEEKLNKSLASTENADEDSLDAFMSSMKNKLDKKSERKLRREAKGLKDEIEQLKKLVEKTEPALPSFTLEIKRTTGEHKPVLNNIADSTDKKYISHCNQDEEVYVRGEMKIPTQTEKEQKSLPKKKKKRMYGAAMMPPPKKEGEKDAEFIEWLPPENQTGDGRTHLNDKLGY